MLKGYWIVGADVSDMEQYKKYIAANAEAFHKYGAKFLVRSGRSTTVEGTARGRNVIVEFLSYQAALDCYNSPEYRSAMKHRLSAATIDIIIIEGYEGA
jgi:uncharacterized protein (DUF1330 family)